MSWSVQGIGKGKDLREYAEQELNRYRCQEPEETMKIQTLNIIQAACDAMPEGCFQLEAYGSQGTDKGVVTSASITLKLVNVKLVGVAG